GGCAIDRDAAIHRLHVELMRRAAHVNGSADDVEVETARHPRRVDVGAPTLCPDPGALRDAQLQLAGGLAGGVLQLPFGSLAHPARFSAESSTELRAGWDRAGEHNAVLVPAANTE